MKRYLLKHRFRRICYDKDFLFNGTNTLSQFMTKLRKQSNNYPDHYEPDTYFGDGFEALVESLINQQGLTKKITSPRKQSITIKSFSTPRQARPAEM